MSSEAIREQAFGPVTVVYLEPDSAPSGDSPLAGLTTQLEQLAESGDPPLVVVDFSQVEHCKAQLLAMLVKVQDRFKKKNGRLVLSGMRQSVRDILQITRLDRILTLEESSQSALATLTGSPSNSPAHGSRGGEESRPG